MQTDALIVQLSSQVPVLPRYAAVKRLVSALTFGSAVAFCLLIAGLGLRPDLISATTTTAFWLKLGYTLSLVWGAAVVVRRLSEPTGKIGYAWWALAAPMLAVAVMGLLDLLAVSNGQRGEVMRGTTFAQCLLAIPVLATPVFVGLLWAFRCLAPTRLRLTGAMAGFLSGATAAAVYTFACPEHAAAFLATWYTAGIAVASIVGTLAGPRFLRW